MFSCMTPLTIFCWAWLCQSSILPVNVVLHDHAPERLQASLLEPTGAFLACTALLLLTVHKAATVFSNRSDGHQHHLRVNMPFWVRLRQACEKDSHHSYVCHVIAGTAVTGCATSPL